MGYFTAISKLEAWKGKRPALSALASALRASWDAQTAYQGRFNPENPAAGQCYPTARVVQWFYPDLEVVHGEVRTGTALERHFWNAPMGSGGAERVDLSWEQFPPGATIARFDFLRTGASADSQGTHARCLLLLRRVTRHLGQQ